MAKAISFLGSQYFIVPALGFLFIFSKYRFKYILPLGIAVGTSGIINLVVKSMVKRERPIIKIVEESGFSFPSGHSMNNMVLYSFIAFLVLRDMKDDKKYIIVFLLYLFIFLVGLSRIYLGVHFFSDVLAGFSLGLFCSSFLFILYDNFYKKD